MRKRREARPRTTANHSPIQTGRRSREPWYIVAENAIWKQSLGVLDVYSFGGGHWSQDLWEKDEEVCVQSTMQHSRRHVAASYHPADMLTCTHTHTHAHTRPSAQQRLDGRVATRASSTIPPSGSSYRPPLLVRRSRL